MRQILILLLIFLLPLSLFPDEISLRNGIVVKGDIIFYRNKSVVIVTKAGQLIVPKGKIIRIKLSAAKRENVYLKLVSGQKISGSFLHESDKYVYFSVNGKKQRILKSRIIQMSWQPLERDRWNVVWRSMLLPSWGQFYDGRKTKGIIIASITGGLAITSLIAYINYNSKLNDYKKAFVNDPVLLDRADKARKLSNAFIIATISAWLLNIGDAILFSRRTDSVVAPKVGMNQNNNSYSWVGLEFTKRF